MRGSKVLGVGMYVPKNVFTNKDIEKMLDTSDEWITQRTGIKQRHWADQSETTSDLGKNAALMAMEKAGVSKEEIDLIIFATLSPDHEFPGTGCFMQAKLEMPGVATLDIRQQCTGFLYGMTIADQFIRSGMYNKVLVVGAETHSRGLDRTPDGRDVSVLFGDGGGAVVVGATEVNDPAKDAHIMQAKLHADGRYADELWVKAPGLACGFPERIHPMMLETKEVYPKMNGKKVYIHAVKNMSKVLMECLGENQIKLEDVDLFLFHQANLRINEGVAEQLKIPREKVFNTIQKYANTTAATIPIGMHDAIEAGKLKPGMLVATAAFGSGFTWAANAFRY